MFNKLTNADILHLSSQSNRNKTVVNTDRVKNGIRDQLRRFSYTVYNIISQGFTLKRLTGIS